jgi:hypothetical protein
MAKVCAALHLATRVCAPDTFEGIPEANAEADAHPRGNFADANYEELADYITPQDRVNLQLLGGSFEESALRWLPMIGGIRLTHIDCDIGTAAAFAFEASIAPMGPGGYLVFDDALYSSYRGATEGVRIPDPT